jgi:hypothetical protein
MAEVRRYDTKLTAAGPHHDAFVRADRFVHLITGPENPTGDLIF